MLYAHFNLLIIPIPTSSLSKHHIQKQPLPIPSSHCTCISLKGEQILHTKQNMIKTKRNDKTKTHGDGDVVGEAFIDSPTLHCDQSSFYFHLAGCTSRNTCYPIYSL